MNRSLLAKLMAAAAIALTIAAVLQELEKPKEKRKWHGKVAGLVPYDFRLPTLKRLAETFWNPYERRLLAPSVLGVGWSINLYRLLEDLGIIKDDVSEEDFLMPTQSIKDALTTGPAADEMLRS